VSQAQFYERSIPIRALRKNRPNQFRLNDELEVVVLVSPDGSFRVFQDICPHMGGPLSQGWYKSSERTIQCPWHGYVYDVDSRELKENPNEAVYACMRTVSSSFKPQMTPRYTLRALEYERRGDELFIRKENGS
jgi:nitrite reductase/ring-hydroxylating ferredoxin subunit